MAWGCSKPMIVMSPLDSVDLAGRVNALAGVTVLVVGDVMLDRFVTGLVDRISPEAPVPVLKSERESTMLGGAGNVLRNLAALGVATVFIGVVGDDGAGEEVRALMEEMAGTNGSHLLVEAGRPTTTKVRYLAGSHQLLRVDRECAASLAEAPFASLIALAEAALPKIDVLILSDYGKGVLSPVTVSTLITTARRIGRTVVVDPKSRDFTVYRGANLITPNRRELSEATGLQTNTDAEVVAACHQVITTCAIDGVLATRSELGMTLVLQAGEVFHLPAEVREVYDVSGAGDTVIAVLGAALAARMIPLDAARLANVAAGIVVGKVGTAVVRPDELVHALHIARLMQAEAKIVSLETVTEQVAVWRRSRLRIGFTNGCFDLLHPGHVSLLRQARATCDRLIAGLNSDASVKRLKGDGRPIQDEMSRAAVLASLADIDRIVVFTEDTPLKLIDAIRPDVLVKGADHTRETVVGAEIVERYGGRILLAQLVPGHSTTATLKRLGIRPREDEPMQFGC